MPREAAADTLTAPQEPTPAAEVESPQTEPAPQASQEPEAAEPEAAEPEAEKPEPSFGDSADKDLAAAFGQIDGGDKEEKADEEPATEAESSDSVPLEDDPRMPKQLRQRVKEQNKLIADMEAQTKALNAKIAAQEKSGEQPALVEAVKAKDEAITKLKGELAGLRFETSEEWSKKYEAPFKKLAGRTRTMVEELEVIEEDEAGMQSVRPANWKTDFIDLWNKKQGERIRIATERFGPAAPQVLNRLEQLISMDQDMQEARAEEQTQWQEKSKQRDAQLAIAKAETNKLWEQVNTEVAEAHPEWFAGEEDEDAKKVESKARELADYYFNTRFDTLETKDQILLEAQMKQRFIALPVVMQRYKAAQAQIKQLEEEIESMSGSDPRGAPRRTAKAAKADPDSPENLRSILEQAFQ